MTKQEILTELQMGETFVEVEKIAEKLTYQISISKKKDSWRSRYDFLSLNDFTQMGYKSIWIEGNEKDISLFLTSNGYLKYEKVFYKEKEIVFIGKNTMVSIEPYFGSMFKFNLCRLSEYQELLSQKLFDIQQKEEEYKNYVLSLIQDKLDLLEQIKEDNMVQDIIEKAIYEAKEKGLIKERKPSEKNFDELKF